jgi:hypothetical protein
MPTIALTTRRSPEATEADRTRRAAMHAALRAEIAMTIPPKPRKRLTDIVERIQAEADARKVPA